MLRILRPLAVHVLHLLGEAPHGQSAQLPPLGEHHGLAQRAMLNFYGDQVAMPLLKAAGLLTTAAELSGHPQQHLYLLLFPPPKVLSEEPILLPLASDHLLYQ